MLNNFFNFDYTFTKLSEIDPCEKHIDMLGGHAWRHIFMAFSKLGAMAIYVVKQACGNDIMPSVYAKGRVTFESIFKLVRYVKRRIIFALGQRLIILKIPSEITTHLKSNVKSLHLISPILTPVI